MNLQPRQFTEDDISDIPVSIKDISNAISMIYKSQEDVEAFFENTLDTIVQKHI